MSLRIFSLTALAALTLTACSGEGDGATGDTNTTVSTDAGAGADAGKDLAKADTIDCALNGASAPQAVCKRTIVQNGDVTQLVLEGPEGDFRRFNILTDGRGLEAADGAEPATITLLDGGKIEVKVDDDTYILPATVKDSGAASAPDKADEAATTAPAAAPKK